MAILYHKLYHTKRRDTGWQIFLKKSIRWHLISRTENIEYWVSCRSQWYNIFFCGFYAQDDIGKLRISAPLVARRWRLTFAGRRFPWWGGSYALRFYCSIDCGKSFSWLTAASWQKGEKMKLIYTKRIIKRKNKNYTVIIPERAGRIVNNRKEMIDADRKGLNAILISALIMIKDPNTIVYFPEGASKT